MSCTFVLHDCACLIYFHECASGRLRFSTLQPLSIKRFHITTNLLRRPCVSSTTRFPLILSVLTSHSNVNPFCVCVCCAAGGGGEEAQSLLGLQLGRASESNLLRQLRQLHGAPALAQTCGQGTVCGYVCVRVGGRGGWDRKKKKRRRRAYVSWHYLRVSCVVNQNVRDSEYENAALPAWAWQIENCTHISPLSVL